MLKALHRSFQRNNFHVESKWYAGYLLNQSQGSRICFFLNISTSKRAQIHAHCVFIGIGKVPRKSIYSNDQVLCNIEHNW